jgi:hypothetical protein
MRRALSLVSAVALVAPAAVAGQFSPGARSVGMGGAGMVFARGVDAIEWNPANLALDGGWNIALGEAGASALLSGVTLDEIREIYDSEGTFDVSDIPSSGLHFTTTSEGFLTAQAASSADLPKPGSPFPTIGASFGPLGVRVRSRVLAEFTLSREVVDLVANGFDPARINDYRVGDTGFRSTSYSEITAAYGTTLGERLALGIGARYVRGHSLTQFRFFEPVVDLLNESIEVTGAAVEAPGGSGFGLDVGLALDLLAGLRVSASGTNIVQKMSWDDSLLGYEATFVGCDNPGGPTCPNGGADQRGSRAAPLDPHSAGRRREGNGRHPDARWRARLGLRSGRTRHRRGAAVRWVLHHRGPGDAGGRGLRRRARDDLAADPRRLR